MAKATPEHGSTDGGEAFGAAPHERPVPRISIHAFCEFPDTGAALQRAAADRRLSKAHVTVQLGGLQAAVEHYTGQVTPNLLIVETRLQGKTAVDEIDRLAEVCDPTTKVVIVGRVNDVELYRELMRRGVSEYLVAPLNPLHLIEVISGLYLGADSAPIGRVVAFIGARAQCRLVHRRRAPYQYDDRRPRSAVRHRRAQLQRRAEPGRRRRADSA
jgi:pilus assembly protein CpaE